MYKTTTTVSTNTTDANFPLQRDGFDGAKTNYRCTLDIDSLSGTAEITSITIDGTVVPFLRVPTSKTRAACSRSL